MIIGITGLLASGKDSAAEYLETKSFNHFSLAQELREIMRAQGVEPDRESMTWFSNDLRRHFGADYLAKRVRQKLVKPAVVSSIRNLPEVLEFRNDHDFKLIFIDAPIELRFKRLLSRNRENDAKMSFEEFIAQEEKEKSTDPHKQQLQLMRPMADIYIQNDGTFDELHQKIDKVLLQIENGQIG